MNTLFFNVIRAANFNTHSLFYQFWATPSSLLYVSLTYLCCLLVICFCLYCNTRANLIYKVLNLAVLSVFVVAAWSYLTDVTFIYVVYILTFVSAVVMLFLSVVLMLPSSAVAVPKKTASGSILLLSALVDKQFIFSATFLMLLVISLYLLCGLYIRSKVPYFYKTKEHAINKMSLKKVTISEVLDRDTYLGQTFEHIRDNYEIGYYSEKQFDFFTHDFIGKHFDVHPFSDTHVRKISQHVNSPTSTIYLGLVPKLLDNKNTLLWNHVKNYVRVVYEFSDFFLAILDNTNIKRSKFFYNLRKFTNRQFLEDHVPIISQHNSCRCGAISIKEHCIEDTNEECETFFYVCRPWWSPFVVISLPRWMEAFDNTQIKSYIGSDFFYKLICDLRNTVAKLFSWFVLNLFDSKQLEILAQLFTSVSIFLLAIPWGQFNTAFHKYSFMNKSAIFDHSFENLAAIQYELYIGSPLLLLVCVVGLLVALIGAALLVSTKVLNSK